MLLLQIIRSTGERDKEKFKSLQRTDSFAASKRTLENTECPAEPSLGTHTIDSIEISRSMKDADSDFFGALVTPHITPSPQTHTLTQTHTHSQGVSPLRTASSSSASPSAFDFDRVESSRELHGIKSPSLAVSTSPYNGNRSPPYFSPASMTASTPANPGTAPFRLHTPTNAYSNSNGINTNGSINSSGADTVNGTGIAMSPSGVTHSDSGKVAVYDSPFSRPVSAFSPSAASSSLHGFNPSPSHRLSINQGQGQGQGQERESPRMHTERILTGLGLKSSSADKTIAARELRHLVRTADDTYWTEYCPQVWGWDHTMLSFLPPCLLHIFPFRFC